VLDGVTDGVELGAVLVDREGPVLDGRL